MSDKSDSLRDRAKLLAAKTGCSLATAQVAVVRARDAALHAREIERAVDERDAKFFANRAALDRVERSGGAASFNVRSLARRIAAEKCIPIGEAQIEATRRIAIGLQPPAELISQRILAARGNRGQK